MSFPGDDKQEELCTAYVSFAKQPLRFPGISVANETYALHLEMDSTQTLTSYSCPVKEKFLTCQDRAISSSTVLIEKELFFFSSVEILDTFFGMFYGLCQDGNGNPS